MAQQWHWPEIEQRYHKNSQALLHQLQDKYFCNVNLVLLAIELDEKSLNYSVSFWQQCQDCAEIFEQQILRPFRAMRAQVKQLAPQQYGNILNAELGLERNLQQQISAIAQQHLAKPQRNASNLSAYLKLQGVQQETATLSQLLQQVCDPTKNVN